MNDMPRSSSSPPPMPRRLATPNLPPMAAGAYLAILLMAAVFVGSAFWWFFCRIEPGADQIAVLIRKTGRDLAPDETAGLRARPEGHPARRAAGRPLLPQSRSSGAGASTASPTFPAGKLGVLTRLYGEEPAAGHHHRRARPPRAWCRTSCAPANTASIPYAFKVELFDAISIRPGSVGVVTSLIGDDVLQGEVPDAERNSFLVSEGRKGVVKEVLDPGTYYLNPYLVNVVEVNLQSQRFELSGEDAISFLTMDGFTVNVEGTIEFSMDRSSAALITHRIGDMEDVLKKIILPRARGFSRIEGSKQPAINFIVGETRQQFQDNLEICTCATSARTGACPSSPC
jgi:hypothetical protein